MKKTLILTVTVLLVFSTGIMAQGMGGHRGGGHGKNFQGQGGGMQDGLPGMRMMLGMADELDLTDAQKEKLQTLRVEFQTEQVDRKAELQKAQIKLKALMADDDASESTVLATIDDISKLKAENQKQRYLHRQEMKSILTPEQQEKAKELRLENRKMRGERNSQRGGGQGMRGSRGGFGPGTCFGS